MEPDNVKEYLKPDYWNKRFEQEESYEWCKGFQEFKHLVTPHLKREFTILVLGCGNSSLGHELCSCGYPYVFNIDISPVALHRQSQRRTPPTTQNPPTTATPNEDQPTPCVSQPHTSPTPRAVTQEWCACDMCNLPFNDGVFDIVIDKGTVEVLFVDSESQWDPGDKVVSRVSRAVNEIYRVLTPKGIFISLSFGQPHFRRPYLCPPSLDWELTVDTYGDMFHYYCYILEKNKTKQQD